MSYQLKINTWYGKCLNYLQAFIDDAHYIHYVQVKLFILCHTIFDQTIYEFEHKISTF